MRSLVSRCLHRWWNNFSQCLIISPHFYFLAWKVDRFILTYRVLRSIIYMRAVQWFPVGKNIHRCHKDKIIDILLLNLIEFFIAKVINFYFNQLKIWRWIFKFIFLSGLYLSSALTSTKCGVHLFKPLPVHTVIYTMEKITQRGSFCIFSAMCSAYQSTSYLFPFLFDFIFVVLSFCLVGWLVCSFGFRFATS